MPVVNTVIVTIFPDNGDAVGSGSEDVFQARGGGIGEGGIKDFGIGFGSHTVVPAAAGCAWAGCP